MVKAGFKTTEFLLTVLSALVISVTAILQSNVFASYPQVLPDLTIGLTVLTSIYSLGRSLVKSSQASTNVVG